MAEERMIDDDLNKDKKYRIRKNADGEEELIIDDGADEAFELPQTPEFSVPETEDEQTESPGQTESNEYPYEVTASECSVLVDKARACMEEGDLEAALKNLDEAQNYDPYYGGAWALRLELLTKNLTDFEDAENLEEVAKNVSSYCTDGQKAALAQNSQVLEQKIIALEEQAAALHVEVEQKKSERREVFLADRKRTLIWFSATAVPFLVCLVVALAFTSVMFARQDGLNIIIMIVFAALAALFFIASLVTGHKLWAAMKKVSLNEKNSSTKIGREYEQTLAEAKKLNTVLHSFKI